MRSASYCKCSFKPNFHIFSVVFNPAIKVTMDLLICNREGVKVHAVPFYQLHFAIQKKNSRKKLLKFHATIESSAAEPKKKINEKCEPCERKAMTNVFVHRFVP